MGHLLRSLRADDITELHIAAGAVGAEIALSGYDGVGAYCLAYYFGASTQATGANVAGTSLYRAKGSTTPTFIASPTGALPGTWKVLASVTDGTVTAQICLALRVA